MTFIVHHQLLILLEIKMKIFLFILSLCSFSIFGQNNDVYIIKMGVHNSIPINDTSNIVLYDRNNIVINQICQYMVRPDVNQSGYNSLFMTYTITPDRFPLRLKHFGGNNNIWELTYWQHSSYRLHIGSVSNISSTNSGYPNFNLSFFALGQNSLGVYTAGTCDPLPIHPISLSNLPYITSRVLQYRTSPASGWTDYNGIQNWSTYYLSVDTFILSTIPGFQNYTGYFECRTKYNTPGYCFPVMYSNSIIADIKRCSPALTAFNQINNVKCFNSNNGSAIYQFDRPLAPEERVKLDLLKRVFPNTYEQVDKNVYIYPYNPNFTLPINGDINVMLDASNKFIIPSLFRLKVTEGYYKFNYQSEFNYPNNNSNFQVGTFKRNSLEFNIDSPPKVTFTVTKENVFCNGNSTGKITLAATGGTGNYLYSIDNGVNWAINPVANSNIMVFNNLPANQTVINATTNVATLTPTYQVLVKDINGTVDCIAPDGKQDIIITQPTDIEFFNDTNTGITQPLSYNSNDGNIKIKLKGGTLNTLITTNNYQNVTVTERNDDIVGSIPVNFPLTGFSSILYDSGSNSHLIELANLSGKKTYVISVTDLKGCTETTTLIIQAPNKIEITFPSFLNPQINCNGETTTIVGKVTGGKTPYEVAFGANTFPVNLNATTGDYDFTFTNQPAGIYGFSVTDANNITSDFNDTTTAIDLYNHTIVDKDLILINGNLTVPQLCFNNNTLIETTVSGGTGTKTFQWLKETTPNNFNIIAGATTEDYITNQGGRYKIEAKDSNNCVKEKVFTVNEATDIVLNLTANNLVENGASTGVISAIIGNTGVNGGAGNYSYELLRTDIPQTIVVAGTALALPISGLFAGNYTLNIKDQNQCLKTTNFTITQPAPFIITTTQNNGITCTNGTAIISISVVGGTPFNTPTSPYIIVWKDSFGNVINAGITTINNTSTITGLTNGNYSVEVRDLNNILRSRTFTVNNPTNVFATAIATNVNCNNGNNGSVIINASGGNVTFAGNTVNYTYLWEKKDLFNNFQPYTASIHVLSGTNNSTATLQGLLAGDYKCTISNTLGCTGFSVTYTITHPSILSASTSVYPLTSTATTDGSITIIPSGGTAPYQFQIDNNIFVPVVPTSGSYTFSNLGFNSGNPYVLIVKDANNCTITINQTIGTIQPLVSSIITNSQIGCFNGNDGSLTGVITGGRPAYTNKWYKVIAGVDTEMLPSNQLTKSNLSAGIYKLVVFDNNTPINTTTNTITLENPSEILLQTTVNNNVNCFSGSNGKVTITFSGGGGIPATMNYNLKVTKLPNTIIQNGNVSISPVILNNLNTGNYEVEIKDQNNCIKTTTFSITQPSTAISAALININNVTINGLSNGGINISVAGGTQLASAPFYTFIWTNLSGQVVSTNQNLTGVPAGSYKVSIKDANNCEFILPQAPSTYFVIDQPLSVLSLSVINSLQPTCFGGNNGSIQVQALGGVAGSKTYTINPSVSSQTSTPDGAIFSNLPAGSYTITVTNAAGETANTVFNVSQPNQLVITPTVTNIDCGSTANGSISLNVSGGLPPYTYQWLHLANNSNSTNFLGNLSATGSSGYNVVVTDSNGCTNSVSNIKIEINGGLSINANVTDITCYNGNNGAILLNPTKNGFALAPSDYILTWNSGAMTGLNSQNLVAGFYSGSIAFSNPVCVIPLNILVSQPDPVVINIDNVTNLCNGQSVSYNIENPNINATYLWTSNNNIIGFPSTNPIATFNQSGTYNAKVTLPSGCIFNKTFSIVQNGNVSVNTEFLIASQTFTKEEIILVNVSDDLTNQYSWIFPPGVEIISQTSQIAIIKFAIEGVYKIKLRGSNALGCEDFYDKDIFIENNPNPNGDLASSSILIKKFIVSPNPVTTMVNGNFNVIVELANVLPINVSIFNLATGVRISTQNSNPSAVHSLNFNIDNQPTGVYYVVLTTDGVIQAKKLIKQ